MRGLALGLTAGLVCVLANGLTACGDDDAGGGGAAGGTGGTDPAGDECADAIIAELKTEQDIPASMEELIRGMVMIRGLEICQEMLACVEAGPHDDCLKPVGTCIDHTGPVDIECSWTGPTSFACECGDDNCTGTGTEIIVCAGEGANSCCP